MSSSCRAPSITPSLPSPRLVNSHPPVLSLSHSSRSSSLSATRPSPSACSRRVPSQRRRRRRPSLSIHGSSPDAAAATAAVRNPSAAARTPDTSSSHARNRLPFVQRDRIPIRRTSSPSAAADAKSAAATLPAAGSSKRIKPPAAAAPRPTFSHPFPPVPFLPSVGRPRRSRSEQPLGSRSRPSRLPSSLVARNRVPGSPPTSSTANSSFVRIPGQQPGSSGQHASAARSSRTERRFQCRRLPSSGR